MDDTRHALRAECFSIQALPQDHRQLRGASMATRWGSGTVVTVSRSLRRHVNMLTGDVLREGFFAMFDRAKHMPQRWPGAPSHELEARRSPVLKQAPWRCTCGNHETV